MADLQERNEFVIACASWNLTTKETQTLLQGRFGQYIRCFFTSCCIIYSSMRQIQRIRKDHGVGGREEESALHLIQDALLV